MKYKALFPLLTLVLLLGASCIQKKDTKSVPNALGVVEGESADTGDTLFDLADIQDGGELLVGILYGPTTYYEFHGQTYGLQCELVQNFASSQGLKARFEVLRDTTELLQHLASTNIDLIAIELPDSLLKQHHLTGCGGISRKDKEGKVEKKYTEGFWAVRTESPDLAEAINQWYTPQIRQSIQAQINERFTIRHPSHKVYAPILDSRAGIISKWDHLFVRHSRRLGWDWRLMAAQCYQESAFDPAAISWAGARGLMQIMPTTASELGLPGNQLHDPSANIEAATRYLQMLDTRFRDIPDATERLHFVLASYNGGALHIRDAMSLTKKHGGNPLHWADVEPYVLALSQPRYYNDPVVQYGYMRGEETTKYVRSIFTRWQQYRQKIKK